jgi:glycosyltransferase involved in cell wall biosynthesis
MIITIDISQSVYQTGVSRYTKELVRNLLKLNTQGKYKYKLFAGVMRQKQAVLEFFQELDAEKLHYTPYIKFFSPRAADLVWNKFHIFPIENFVGRTDIMHTSNWAQPPAKAKIITTVHDLTPIIMPQHHGPKIIQNFKRNLKWAQKEAQTIICDSYATQKDLISYFDSDPKLIAKTVVIHIAASKDFHYVEDKQKRRAVKDKYGITGPYLLCLGTREPRKNLKRTIEAYLKAQAPYKLVIAGKYGWGEDVNANTQNPNIITAGFVDDNDLPSLYSSAKALIYPSLYEGFGLPVLEALNCQCPVITSRNSSLPEVAGDAALYVDPLSTESITKAIQKITTNDAVRGKLLLEAKNQVKKFSWTQTAKYTLKEYKKLMQGV